MHETSVQLEDGPFRGDCWEIQLLQSFISFAKHAPSLSQAANNLPSLLSQSKMDGVRGTFIKPGSS